MDDDWDMDDYWNRDDWQIYCCFCAGPFGYIRDYFVEDVTGYFVGKSWPPKDGKWKNPKGFPVPNKPVKEIVRITHEDSQYWEENVVAGPQFEPTWVSHPAVRDLFGELRIDGSTSWQIFTDKSYNVVHINCLSLLCRRLDITPEEWWLSFYGPESDYEKWFPYEEDQNMLKEGIEYYDMKHRNKDQFGYAIKFVSKKGNDWWDPDTYEDCNWIFASPAKFPCVTNLPTPLEEAFTSNPSSNQTACHKVFFTSDLLFIILDFAVPYVPQEIVTEQMVSQYEINDCPTVVRSIHTILSMLRVNKRIYNWIIQSRQDLFFRIVWQMGYMLPACPLDWKSWNGVNDPLPPLTGVPIYAIPGPHNPDRKTSLSNAKDWRAYLIIYLRLDDRHAKSRYRLHRLHMQHARGKVDERDDGTKWKYWSCGNFGVGTALECPEPYEWEKDEYVPVVDTKNLGDDDLDDPTGSDYESDSEDDDDESDGPKDSEDSEDDDSGEDEVTEDEEESEDK